MSPPRTPLPTMSNSIWDSNPDLNLDTPKTPNKVHQSASLPWSNEGHSASSSVMAAEAGKQ